MPINTTRFISMGTVGAGGGMMPRGQRPGGQAFNSQRFIPLGRNTQRPRAGQSFQSSPSVLPDLAKARFGAGVSGLGTGLLGAGFKNPTLLNLGKGLGAAGHLAGIPLSILGKSSDIGKGLSVGRDVTGLLNIGASIPSVANAIPGLSSLGGLKVPGTGISGLGAAGGLLGTGLGSLQLAEGNIGGGIGSLAGVASMFLPPPFNIIGAVGLPLIGSLFGGKKPSHAQREAKEASRDIGAATGFSRDVASAQDVKGLFAAGLPWMSGYVGGSQTPAVSVDARLPQRFLDRPTAEFDLPDELTRVPYLFGERGAGYYPTILPDAREDALRWLAQNPQSLSVQLQSGISQGLKDQFNTPFLNQLQSILASFKGAGPVLPRSYAQLPPIALPPPAAPTATAASSLPAPTWPTTSEGERLPWSHLLQRDEYSGQPIYGPEVYALGKAMEDFSTGSA